MIKINLMMGDCLERMKEIPDESIDLIVTSPPYDNLRSYNGSNTDWSFGKFEQIGFALSLLLRPGGVLVWIVGDSTINGSESCSSFKQAIFFKDECRLNLHDTMIYSKNNVVPLTHNRYEQAFEYMFVFSKGSPKTFNPIEDKPNKRAGEVFHGTQYSGDETRKMTFSGKKKIREFGRRLNIFQYNNPGDKRRKHPAVFPDQLAIDHVLSWSNSGDTVMDPFLGSGTTGVACKNLNRNFIGIERDEKYFEIAKERIEKA